LWDIDPSPGGNTAYEGLNASIIFDSQITRTVHRMVNDVSHMSAYDPQRNNIKCESVVYVFLRYQKNTQPCDNWYAPMRFINRYGKSLE